MKHSKKIILFAFIAAFTIIACKTKKETKTTTTSKTTVTPTTVTTTTTTVTTTSTDNKIESSTVTYETLQPLLSKSCNISGCHDESHPRINFKNYATLKHFGDRGEINHAVLDKKFMPPDEKLTDSELALFRRWIELGMPEK